MTTAITINAHAGWDVEVRVAQLNEEGKEVTATVKIVSKHTEQTVYIHSHQIITSIKELPN